jgi:hypothetical protein
VAVHRSLAQFRQRAEPARAHETRNVRVARPGMIVRPPDVVGGGHFTEGREENEGFETDEREKQAKLFVPFVNFCSNQFHARRETFAAPDTNRRNATLHSAFSQRRDQCHQNSRPARPNRMAQRDRSATDIDPLVR